MALSPFYAQVLDGRGGARPASDTELAGGRSADGPL